MYDLDLGLFLLFLVALIVFFAVAAIFGWGAAGWTALGIAVAAIIRYAGRG